MQGEQSPFPRFLLRTSGCRANRSSPAASPKTQTESMVTRRACGWHVPRETREGVRHSGGQEECRMHSLTVLLTRPGVDAGSEVGSTCEPRPAGASAAAFARPFSLERIAASRWARPCSLAVSSRRFSRKSSAAFACTANCNVCCKKVRVVGGWVVEGGGSGQIHTGRT